MVSKEKELDSSNDDDRFDVANYCTDKFLMEQRALHETLNRLLWRYSMEHRAKPSIPSEIYYDPSTKKWGYLMVTSGCNYFAPRFDSWEIARNAIEEIVKPFMEAHPEFKW